MAARYLIIFIHIFSQILIFAIFARVLLSWIRIPSQNWLTRFLVQTTEPILVLFRRFVPPLGGILDISPILAYFSIVIVRSFLIGLLV